MAATPKPLHGAYTIVTGGSKGIGRETVKGLMAQGCHVVIAARDTAVCEAVAGELRAAQLPGSCTCAKLDLEDPASIQRFARDQKEELRKRGAPLQILVNNAGVMGVGYTSQGEDRHMLCNHLGPFMLTQLLADSLVPGSRVVSVASRAQKAGRLDWDDQGKLIGRKKAWVWRYSDSKLANVVWTAELQRRWGPRGIHAVSVSPGFVATSLFTSLPWPLNYLVTPVIPYLGRTPAQGAETVIWAATSPAVTGSEEQLFLHDCKPLEPLAVARDPRVGQLLWAWSEKWMAANTTKLDT